MCLSPTLNSTVLQAATDGGAMQLFTTQAAGSGNRLAVMRSTFTNNTAGKFGGGVAVYSQGVDIWHSQFDLNQVRRSTHS